MCKKKLPSTVAQICFGKICVRHDTCVNHVCIEWVTFFIVYHFPFFLSQFPSPYCVQAEGLKPPPISPAPLVSPYYSPSPHPTIIPLNPPSAFSILQSTPQQVSSVALPGTFPALTMSFAVPQQQNGLTASYPNISGFHYTPSLPLSQALPTPYPVSYPEQEVAEQVNI